MLGPILLRGQALLAEEPLEMSCLPGREALVGRVPAVNKVYQNVEGQEAVWGVLALSTVPPPLQSPDKLRSLTEGRCVAVWLGKG